MGVSSYFHMRFMIIPLLLMFQKIMFFVTITFVLSEDVHSNSHYCITG